MGLGPGGKRAPGLAHRLALDKLRGPKADYAGWHPDIQTVIDAIDQDSCFRHELSNRPPVDNWSTQRATLLGDAAHPLLPYMASGAAMAIEDAAEMRHAFQQKNLTQDRSKWLYSYDPLEVSLQDPE